MTREWTTRDGVRLVGDEWGDSTGPLVVLLHGGGQTRHAWKGTGQQLAAAGYHAIAFDARGHGDSGWSPDGLYTQDAMVEDLLAVLGAYGDPRPVLVGASMGGGTSLVAIGEDHVDATALVLVDIAPRVSPSGVERIRAFMTANPEGFASLEEVADAIGRYQPHRQRPDRLDGLAKNVRRRPDGRFRWHWDPKFMDGPRDLESRQARLEACARRLTLPVLVVRGSMSDVLSEEDARALLELCPHARLLDVQGAAHMVAGDRNDTFGAAVIDFLAETVPVGAQPIHPAHDRHPAPPIEGIVDIP